MSHRFLLHRRTHPNRDAGQTDSLELQVTSSDVAEQTAYVLEGNILAALGRDILEGGSLIIHLPADHLAHEVFFDAQGHFRQSLELQADRQNLLSLTVYDAGGYTVGSFAFTVRHGAGAASAPGPAVVGEPITKDIWIEVVGPRRQRVRHTLAPAGASWPGPFQITCRTGDNSGQIVVPVIEHDRLLDTVILTDIGTNLPPGSPVELQLTCDGDSSIQLEIFIPAMIRRETRRLDLAATPEPPPVIEETAEFKPDWPDFARLVKDCLILAGEIADRTGRNRQELFEQIYSQERYAEQAFEKKNAGFYRECFTNLMKFAQYLEQLQQEHQALVQGAYHPPGRDDVLRAVNRVERELLFLHSRLRSGQTELLARLNGLRQALPTLARRADRDVPGAVTELRQVFKDLDDLHARCGGRPSRPEDTTGLLAGPG